MLVFGIGHNVDKIVFIIYSIRFTVNLNLQLKFVNIYFDKLARAKKIPNK